MPGPLIQFGAQLTCPHGGTITITPPGPRVKIGTASVASIPATGTVANCSNTGPNLKPCTTVKWVKPSDGATRVTLNGMPALLLTSRADFDSVPPVSGMPAGIRGPNAVQARVKAT
jgi:hypothetical protein